MTLAADSEPAIAPQQIHWTNETGESFSILRFPFVAGRPLLHWAHATGFNATTYRPLLQALAGHFNVLAWDMRGHGASSAPADPGRLRDWTLFYDDLAAYLESLEGPLLLAGHSVGAVCSLVAAARLGPRVEGLCLVDPILMCGAAGVGFGLLKRAGLGDRHPLVAGALRRGRTFPSRQAVLDNYARKRVFAGWAPEFLAAYADGGFRSGGAGVELCCAPEWEARQFATTEHDPWGWVERIRCPVLLVQAERESTILPGAVRRFRQLHRDTRHRVYRGTTHFVPMESAERLAGDLLAFAQDVRP